MSTPEESLETKEQELSSRIKSLEDQLQRLERLERLSARISDEEAAAATAKKKEYPTGELSDVSEEVLSWAGQVALLPRLATLCFLLVVALILRTITDSGVIDKLIGSGIGMGYAAVLMAAGWYYYSRKSPLAPVIAASGAVLMSTIVVETHTHFQSLPLVPAYLTLMATGIAMALISRQFHALTPVSVGVLGMCLAGAAIDYPRPYFPYLALILFTANLLGYFAAQLKRCSWIRWIAFLVTVAMLQLWGVQVVTALRKGEGMPPALALEWFYPTVALFAVTYLVLALLGILRSGTERISRFDLSLPTLNALWAFSISLYVASAQGSKTAVILGIIGVLAGVSHLAASFWLAQRDREHATGAATFTFACGVLLGLALPAATGRMTLSLPVISLVAIFMAIMSRNWNSGTVRITTYIFQVYCSVALAIVMKVMSTSGMDAINILPAGLLACITLYHYLWCRWWPPQEGSSFFSRFDRHDRSAALLLIGGLVSGFFALRIAIYQTLLAMPGGLQQDIYRCAQSVCINTAAIGLVLYAYLRRDREVRNVAILVMFVGGVRVFLGDLISTHGLPLVFSVFSFGMAAAIESVALTKWQKQPAGKSVKE